MHLTIDYRICQELIQISPQKPRNLIRTVSLLGCVSDSSLWQDAKLRPASDVHTHADVDLRLAYNLLAALSCKDQTGDVLFEVE